MMYTSFFALTCNPFQLTPDPEFLFLSKDHKKALTYLNYGIAADTGFILVTGEVGTGKTTLIRRILKELNKDIKVARVNNTLVNSEQLIAMISDDFGIETQGKDKTRMLRDLSDFIISQYARGCRTTLIIDEAQNLSPELLEEVRLLSNLETDKSKLLQIILAGQPELKQTLALPKLRQLRQRISISCHINPLDRNETEAYIFHRLGIAGNRSAVAFLDGALNLLHEATHGIPRLINIFCDFLLLAAFSEGTKEISVDLVQEIARDIDSETRYWTDIEPEKGQEIEPKVIKSILIRLDAIESAMQGSSVSKADIDELAIKISHLETSVSPAVEKTTQELHDKGLHNSNVFIQKLLREIDDLKRKSIELEQKQLLAVESSGQKQKAFWSRIFN
ncbi:MAG: XrtA/PEP-CTERM system-associated ATPase [Dissulfurispiraceae bacterium]